MADLSRRAMLAGSAAAAATLSTPAQSAAPPAGRQAAGFYRYRIGSFEVTALYDGIWNRAIDEKFIRNAPWSAVEKALANNFLPARTLPTPFTALLVNTGARLVLIDTGTGGQFGSAAGSLGANLAAAGVDPKAIDVILISHFHADHINGLKTKDGGKVFPNAEINVPAAEWAYWMDDARMDAAPDGAKVAFRNARRIFADLAKDVRRFEPGKDVTPGITAIAAHGHTPGHTAFAIASGNQSALVLGDTTNHPWLFARNPDWQAIFDVDGDMAAATRRTLLDRAAADRMLVQGYHFPFPASGYIARAGTGYDFVPAMWQPSL
jgi:glyoxylase-like metal-dependent hydrolase (beta-lactamase superfamily II)